MNSAKRKKINQLADTVRRGLEENIPIDLHALVYKLGGEVKYFKQTDDEPEAKILKIGGSFEIHLAENRNKARENFSIAHELGHLFIHMGYLINSELWNSVNEYQDGVYYRYGYSQEEFEANEFAAALLMPEPELIQYIEGNLANGYCDLIKVAERFKVSPEAVKTRGRWLGLFS